MDILQISLFCHLKEYIYREAYSKIIWNAG